MREIRLIKDWLPAFAAAAARQWLRTARLMIGIPDYENYVEHRKEHHPGEPVMSYKEFFRERQNARYACGNGKFRGCC
jgi:uncharacterized short protein YbdD (DUF466 family)